MKVDPQKIEDTKKIQVYLEKQKEKDERKSSNLERNKRKN